LDEDGGVLSSFPLGETIMNFRFTKHARKKMELLRRYGFPVTEEQIIKTVLYPESVEKDEGVLIAQRAWDEQHLLRVVYKKEESYVIITMYPGRRDRYEQS
jgi:hypothetical protein